MDNIVSRRSVHHLEGHARRLLILGPLRSAGALAVHVAKQPQQAYTVTYVVKEWFVMNAWTKSREELLQNGRVQ